MKIVVNYHFSQRELLQMNMAYFQMSSQQLADLTGFSVNTIRRFRDGSRRVSDKVWAALESFGASVDKPLIIGE